MDKAPNDPEYDNELDEDEEPSVPAVRGGKNYITPQGFKRLQDELKLLKYTERPEVTRVVTWAAGNGDRSENGDYLYGKKRLREIDRRMRFLAKHLENAEVVDPTQITSDTVLFGATVTFQDEDGEEKTYSIVGGDELDIERGKISWLSPLATALMKKREGDVVLFRFPRGIKELEILKIQYIAIE